jgi:hypothetical protein
MDPDGKQTSIGMDVLRHACHHLRSRGWGKIRETVSQKIFDALSAP